MMNAWESERFEWSTIRAAAGRTAERVPDALESLRTSTNEHEASEAYWRLDNFVIIQGSLFDAALPTAACLVTLVGITSGIAREKMIELLEQISSGEAQDGKKNLKAEISSEICRAFTVYVGLLQYGSDLERELCLNLIVVCARERYDLRAQARFYVTRLLEEQNIPQRLRTFAQDSLEQESTLWAT